MHGAREWKTNICCMKLLRRLENEMYDKINAFEQT